MKCADLCDIQQKKKSMIYGMKRTVHVKEMYVLQNVLFILCATELCNFCHRKKLMIAVSYTCSVTE